MHNGTTKEIANEYSTPTALENRSAINEIRHRQEICRWLMF